MLGDLPRMYADDTNISFHSNNLFELQVDLMHECQLDKIEFVA